MRIDEARNQQPAHRIDRRYSVVDCDTRHRQFGDGAAAHDDVGEMRLLGLMGFGTSLPRMMIVSDWDVLTRRASWRDVVEEKLFFKRIE
jgi:hypothetical protein